MKMRHIILRLLVAVSLSTAMLLAMPSIALAIDEPDSVSVEGVLIFQDLIETDDFLTFVPYNLAFTTEPDEPADDAYIFRIISTDNGSEYGTALPNPSYNNGYGAGVVSFYFESGMVWEGSYTIRVQQNPTYYPTPDYWDFELGASNYSAASDQADALKNKVIDSATYLSTVFDEALLDKSDSGQTILSTEGEIYYLTIIPGMQSMSPNLFETRLVDPDYTKRNWSYTLADTLNTKYSGTFLGDFMTGWAGMFNMESLAASMFLSIIGFAALMLVSVWKFKASMLSAFVDGYAFLLLLMLMGFFPMEASGGMAFASVVLGGVILFLNRA